jgi:hypothetical protein
MNTNPISALQKWKIHFSWDEPKIGLRDVPFHPNIKKSSIFDLFEIFDFI